MKEAAAKLALSVAFLLPIVSSAQTTQSTQTMLDGITFDHSSTVYLPVREVADALSLNLRYDDESDSVFLNDKKVDDSKRLFDNTRLLPIRSIDDLGGKVEFDPATQEVRVSIGLKEVLVRIAPKHVVINKDVQELRAYQGDRLVFKTHVSTGRAGHRTPSGTWKAGPEKTPLRHSHKYENAPMPWATQVCGDVFMHGYGSVPRYPASHGCIRIPVRGKNAARWFYGWMQLGVPVTIGTKWIDANPDGAMSLVAAQNPDPAGQTSQATVPINSVPHTVRHKAHRKRRVRRKHKPVSRPSAVFTPQNPIKP